MYIFLKKKIYFLKSGIFETMVMTLFFAWLIWERKMASWKMKNTRSSVLIVLCCQLHQFFYFIYTNRFFRRCDDNNKRRIVFNVFKKQELAKNLKIINKRKEKNEFSFLDSKNLAHTNKNYFLKKKRIQEKNNNLKRYFNTSHIW